MPMQMLKEFHEKFGLAINEWMDADPGLVKFRQELIREEAAVAIEALDSDDKAWIAQELADLVYVAYGAAVTFGINLDTALAEVHRANMTKLGEDGKPIYREDGKVLKGPNYKEPNMYQKTIIGDANGF
jgi:predicted HAD superfamily Cof-like phosphohydrolase